MERITFHRLWETARNGVALLCAVLLILTVLARSSLATAWPQQDVAQIPPDQLDSLVAPIALYPDPLLAQVFAASTYPLEIIQLQQWLQKHPDLKDKALADAVQKEDWDPSVQAMAALPTWSNAWRMTSSGRRISEMPFWRRVRRSPP